MGNSNPQHWIREILPVGVLYNCVSISESRNGNKFDLENILQMHSKECYFYFFKDIVFNNEVSSCNHNLLS